jgi:hypothetical protein
LAAANHRHLPRSVCPVAVRKPLQWVPGGSSGFTSRTGGLALRVPDHVPGVRRRGIAGLFLGI